MSFVRCCVVLAVSLLTFACSEEPAATAPPVEADWAGTVIRTDPMFGGGMAVVERVEAAPQLRWAGAAEERAALVEQLMKELDATARADVEERLRPEVAAAGNEFLRSKAGIALLAAEATAVAGGAGMFDDLPQRLGRRAGDPAKVKDAAERFQAVSEKHVDRGAVSPFVLAELLALSRIEATESTAIGTFLATDLGAAWLQARTAAWPEARRRVDSVLAILQKDGFVENTLEGRLPDLLLPGPESVEAEGGTGR